MYLRSFKRDGVHAVPPANVAGVEPVHLQVARGRVLPAEEVGVQNSARVAVCRMPNSCATTQMIFINTYDPS